MLKGKPHWNELTQEVIGACIEVHRELGPGLLESIYEDCLSYELSLRQLGFERQVHLPLTYKGVILGKKIIVDLFVENSIIVELKAVDRLIPLHKAQVLTYLKLTRIPVGLLINFNSVLLKDGIQRVMLGGES